MNKKTKTVLLDCRFALLIAIAVFVLLAQAEGIAAKQY